MSKGTGYVMIDKYLAQDFKSIRREFSTIEAMFSYTLDQDNGLEGSISGYSKLWGWSRWKVRKFIENIRSEHGHYPDMRQTQGRHPIHFIDKALWAKTDRRPTEDRQKTDTTINPNPKHNPKEKKKDIKKKPRKKKFVPPSKDQVIKYFIENEYDANKGAEAFEFYNCADWHDSRGNQVKNWKQKMRGVWFKIFE